MYNFSVADFETYYVSSEWVHYCPEFTKNADIFNKLNVDDVATLNKKFGNGQTMQDKAISTVLANASNRKGGIDQAASVI